MKLLLHESQEVIAKTELDVNSELANPNIYDTVQKQPSRGVPRKRCYGVIQENTHVEVRFQESCFSHAKVLLALWHGCSPENLLHVSRTPFSRNTSRWLLLPVQKRRELYAKHKSHEKELDRRRTNKWRKVKDQEK